MKPIKAVLGEIADSFTCKGMINPKRQAEDLLCDFLNTDRLHWNLTHILNDEQIKAIQKWVQRRLQGEPLAYICGKIQFYDCLFEVNSNVLIPRPETEILVDIIAASLKKQAVDDKILWDLCCGSGCIGIALKKMFPSLIVYLSDISEAAVELASRNAKFNKVEVACLCGDLLSPFQEKKTHFLVSNPPYISEKEYAILDREVKDFEPRLALVGGKTGLEMYARLADELLPFLYPQAQVWFEIGYQQGESVKNLFHSPPWKNQRFENDWADHHRFFFLENE